MNTTQTSDPQSSTIERQNPIDPLLFREVLGHYPTGVALITATVDGEPIGMVVGTFSSVSLDPALIAFMPTRGSRTFARLRSATSFCVNVLASDQEDICRLFARPGDDKFAGVGWSESASGAPILDGVVAALDCSFESVIEAGDHYIVLGKVADLRVVKPVAPLLFFQGGYGRFAETSLVAFADADVVAGVRLAEIARPLMEGIANDIDVECTAFAPVGNDLSIVAVAVGRNATTRSTLGSRVPLIPPLGEQYVANEPDEAVERWLQRSASGTRDAEVVERYRARLRRARERGWSASIAGGGSDEELFEAVREYSDGERTPARLSRLRTVIHNADDRYEAVDLEEGRLYDLSTLSAPVIAADGRVHLILRMSQLPPQVGATVVAGWVERLIAAATEVARRAGEREPAL